MACGQHGNGLHMGAVWTHTVPLCGNDSSSLDLGLPGVNGSCLSERMPFNGAAQSGPVAL